MIAARASWVIIGTVLLALVLYAMPLPAAWRWYRPELPMLVLFYWSLALPHRVGVISAACVGFALDLLNGTALGSLAAGMVLSALFILLNYQRIRQFDLIQQSVVMALLVALALVVERWLQNLVGVGSRGLMFLYPVLLSLLCWPLTKTVLRQLRRSYEVS